VVYVPDLITCFKFGDDRFRGLASAEGQILSFPIDFDGRPYNTTHYRGPCERVMLHYKHGCSVVFLINNIVIELNPLTPTVAIWVQL